MTATPAMLPPHLRIALRIPEDLTKCWVWTAGVGKHGFPVGPDNFTPLQYHVYRRVHGQLRAFDRPYNTCGDRLCLNPDHIAAKVRVIGKRNYG